MVIDLNNIFEKFVGNLSDNVKWKKIQNNLAIIKEQFGGIAKNINNIDIQKATLFERNVRNLIEKNNGEGLQKAVESLQQLLGMTQNNISSNQTSNNDSTLPNSLNNLFSFDNTDKTKDKKSDNKNTQKTDNSDFENKVIELLSNIVSACGGTTAALNKTLSVKVAGNNINNIFQ